MTVSIHTPKVQDDNIRIMPSTQDLAKPHSEKQLIDEALAEFQRPKNLIASSRQELPNITVNGVSISPSTIAQEMQYHPAASQDKALYLAAQALTLRELLRQAVIKHPKLGEKSWFSDEEQAIARLIEDQVVPQSPERETCLQYYQNHLQQFVTTPVMNVRHILLAAPPEAADDRLELKKQAKEMIQAIHDSDNQDATFIELARQHSACFSKEQGGELGVLSKGQTVSEFELSVFTLPVGLSVNPVETRYGIHVVEVLRKEEGQQLSFEEAYPAINNHLKQQSFHHKLCDYLFELSQQADIVGIQLIMNDENVYRG